MDREKSRPTAFGSDHCLTHVYGKVTYLELDEGYAMQIAQGNIHRSVSHPAPAFSSLSRLSPFRTIPLSHSHSSFPASHLLRFELTQNSCTASDSTSSRKTRPAPRRTLPDRARRNVVERRDV
jgi:hypothetical protein